LNDYMSLWSGMHMSPRLRKVRYLRSH
jgi:hypothetical protein